MQQGDAMNSGDYKPDVDKKPVSWIWTAVTAVIAAVVATGYNASRAMNGTLIHVPENASAFEAGRTNPYTSIAGGAFGAAIVIWLIFWALCKVNNRTSGGWRAFAIIAVAAALPSVVLFAVASASVAAGVGASATGTGSATGGVGAGVSPPQAASANSETAKRAERFMRRSHSVDTSAD